MYTITGGNLTFKGAGPTGGVINSFLMLMQPTRGKRTFQIIRVPQYSNLTLLQILQHHHLTAPLGWYCFFTGTFNFNGRTIDGNARGFRGGYSPITNSGANNSSTYVGAFICSINIREGA
jgi:hypothetical protein